MFQKENLVWSWTLPILLRCNELYRTLIKKTAKEVWFFKLFMFPSLVWTRCLCGVSKGFDLCVPELLLVLARWDLSGSKCSITVSSFLSCPFGYVREVHSNFRSSVLSLYRVQKARISWLINNTQLAGLFSVQDTQRKKKTRSLKMFLVVAESHNYYLF